MVDMTASTDGTVLESSPLAKLFSRFGTIVSLTTRQKPGLNRSWGFITYELPGSAQEALKAEHELKHGSVQLQVEKANVDEQLQRSETGALADVWRRQQEKEVLWMRSLLEGMQKSPSYKASKQKVAESMGLREEEIDDGACSPI